MCVCVCVLFVLCSHIPDDGSDVGLQRQKIKAHTLTSFTSYGDKLKSFASLYIPTQEEGDETRR